MKRPLLIFAILFTLLLILLQNFQAQWVFLRTAIDTGDYWRLLSSQFVHTNWNHVFLNLVGFWLFIALCHSVIHLAWLMLNIILIALGIGFLLYWQESYLQWYAGFSGVVYGLFIMGGLHLILARDYLTGIGLIALILVKLGLDAFQGGNPLSEKLIEAPVIEAAHYYGIALAALLNLPIVGKTFYRHLNNPPPAI